VNNDGSTGICCLPRRGGSQQQQQQQSQFSQNQFAQSQQQLVSANVIDSRPAYTSSVATQQPLKPFNNAPRPPPPQPFIPPPRPVNPVPQAVNQAPQTTYPAPQPSYTNNSPPRPAPQPSYPAPQPINNVDSRPSQTQFFQQQSPAINQFPIQAIKVPANSQTTYQPPRPSSTQQPPRYEAPTTIRAPTSGCGIRSVSPGTPQDGESAPGEFPWQALILSNDGTRLCSGAVIGESAILVSATCVQG